LGENGAAKLDRDQQQHTNEQTNNHCHTVIQGNTSCGIIRPGDPR
jgi:hypothetical protein